MYLAPYRTNRERVLGITVAFWGRGDDAPIAQNVELDLRRLYVDTIRKEAVQYRKHCDSGTLEFDEKSPMAKNMEVFRNENDDLPFDYRDQSLQMYNALKPTPATFSEMTLKITPVIQLLSVGIVDSYFTLGYGTEPKFPSLLNAVRACGPLPDLSLRDAAGNSFTVSGSDFVTELAERYEGLVLQNPKADDIRWNEEPSGQRKLEGASAALVGFGSARPTGMAPRVAPIGSAPLSKSFF